MKLLKSVAVAGLALSLGISTALAEEQVLRAASYLDVETGDLVSPANIVIEDGMITAVNPDSLPDGAEVIDLGETILLPGLMDVHTHLTYDIAGDWVNRPVKETAAESALRGADNAYKTLLAGFTTVRDLGAAGGFTDVALMHAVENGWISGPDVIPTGHALSITGGHCETTGFAPGILERDWRSGVADGVTEVVKAVRYQIKHGARAIKICATAGVLSFEGPVGAQQYSLEEMQAIAEEAHRHGIKVAAHAHGTEGIIAASEAGIDTIEHNSIMTEEAARILLANGTHIVPNIYLIDRIDMDALPEQLQRKMEIVGREARESFRRAVEMGVPILFGTDSAVYPHGENAKEFAAQVALGQSPLAAIRSATIVPADYFGLDDRGRIAPGLKAHIIGVADNPLEDIATLESVTFVTKDDHIYKRP